MKVLVDTSAWVDFLNGHPSPERNSLRHLISGDDDVCTCGVVVAEVFQGLRRPKGRDALADLFRELTYLETGGIESHLRAAELYRDLRSAGVTIRSTIDCLIAVLAARHGCHLLARDRDLTAIVESQLLPLREWRLA